MPETASDRPDRIAECCIPLGAVLAALGAAVILGWLLHVPVLVQLAPGYPPMAFNTALGFVLLGAALAIPAHVARRARAQALAGAVVALLAAPVLAQDLLAVDLGVDDFFSGAWLEDPRAHPTMAYATAIALVLAGAALIMTNVLRQGILLYLTELAVLAIALIALLAASAYAFGIDFLLGWYPYQHMALHTAFGLLLLSAGLWLNLRHSRVFHEQVLLKEDRRILHTGAVILVLTAVASGVVTFVVLQRQIESTLKRGLELLLVNRVDAFRAAFDEGAQETEAIASNPALRRELAQLRTAPGQPDAVAFLDRAVGGFLPLGFSAVALHDARGRAVVQAGRFAVAPAFRAGLPDAAGAELLWADGLVLRVRRSVAEAGKPLGTVVTERRLGQIDRLFQDIRGLGETGEMVACAARGDGMVCLPTRLRPEVFSLERRIHGQSLPMSRALDGATGVVMAIDYRGMRVIAAHGPIPRTGLGLVVKIDADELYRPVFENSLYGLPPVVALLGAGLWLLWRQVRPLARQLLESQRQVRELSLTDELTGLRNRRGFTTLAEAELALARRMQRPLLLFYADLDGFKDINDTWGHAEGDRALRDVAAVLRRTFRDADILARLGGDEFAVLALANGEGNADTIVGRLQSNVEQLNETAGRRYRLALSVGVVRCEPASRRPLDELLAQADAEMYRAKQERRAARRN